MKIGIVNHDFTLGRVQRVAIEVAIGLSLECDYEVELN